MKKCVIFVDNGMIQDVLIDSKEKIDFLVVDFDKKTLDQSVVEILEKPYEFGDFCALADMYTWEGYYDPKKVKEIYRENDRLKGI